MVYGAMMNGWALSKLWSWFIVSTFALPALTIPAAIGVALVVNYLTQARKCPACQGKGGHQTKPFWITAWIPCEKCKGTGRIGKAPLIVVKPAFDCSALLSQRSGRSFPLDNTQLFGILDAYEY